MGLWRLHGRHSFLAGIDVAAYPSAILEDRAQHALHPKWTAPAGLQGCQLKSGFMSVPEVLQVLPHIGSISSLFDANATCK